MSILGENGIKETDVWDSLPWAVWPALHPSFETPHRLRYFEPVKIKGGHKMFHNINRIRMRIFSLWRIVQLWLRTYYMKMYVLIKWTLPSVFDFFFFIYLGETFLAIIFKVFGVDVNVVLVNLVRFREFGRILQELVDLDSGRVQTAVIERLHRNVWRCHGVWRVKRPCVILCQSRFFLLELRGCSLKVNVWNARLQCKTSTQVHNELSVKNSTRCVVSCHLAHI